MGQYGYKIRNFKAATVLAYNMGLRDHYDYTGAMLHHSLFTRFLESAGMKIYNGESTRDVVCMDFGFGLRGFEDEFDHVHDMLRKAQEDGNDELASYIQSLETRVVENKDKYIKLSKDEIRRIFYEEGVDIVYSHTDRKTGEITDVTIHYRMLYRNASKAKVGQCMFINERLYDAAHDWMTMGICNRMVPGEKAKIVELSAYAPLSTSSIMGTIHISVDSVLILKDQDSLFNTMADVVESEEYESSVREVDEIKTEQNRKKALQAGKTVYRMAYHSVPKIKRRCVVHREKTDVKNTLWDGMALIETNICPDDKVNGMVLLRNHFFKACAFRSRLSLFFGNYCREHGLDYETYTIKDMFGRDVPVKDIKMITTNNAIKWLKFVDLMGGDLESAYNHWRERLIADGEEWGMVKTDHPSKIGDVQQMSYQMVNTLPCSKDDIAKIAETSVSYVEKLKTDNDEFERFLRKHATAVNHYEMLADLYAWNHDFANSRFFANDRRKIISNYVYHLRNGKIAVRGDNLTVCGNPYGLLLYSVGENYEKDPTLQPEKGVVQVYTTKFNDGEYLCGIRSPQNSANNIGYFVNRKHPLMDQYFDFSPNIMAVNCLHTDIQARMNGEDSTKVRVG